MSHRVLNIHILILLSVARLGIGSAGIISRQDLPSLASTTACIDCDEPDESRTEHCVGCAEHGLFEGVEGTVGADQRVVDDGVAFDGGGAWGHSAEEEVVVVGHAGVVEEVGGFGAAGVLEDELFGGGVVGVETWVFYVWLVVLSCFVLGDKTHQQ